MPDLTMIVDTALSEVPINLLPLLDATDFKTIEDAVVYNAAGMDLVWNFVSAGGVFTQTAVTPTDTGGAHDWVNQGNGMYTLEIPASGGTINNDAEGYGWFTGVITGVLPFRGPVIQFSPANVVNSLVVGSDALQVHLTEVSNNFFVTAMFNDGFLTAAKFASGAFDAVWSVTARLLTAGTNIVLAKGTGVTGFNDLSAAQVNAEADTALADYDPPTRAELTSDTNSILSKLLKYVQLMLRKDAAIATDNATEVTAINADGGSGGGAFANTTDSQEAIRDKETDIETDTADIQGRLPAALVSGRIDASVGAMAANVLTASALATDAVNEIVDQTWEEAITDHSGTSGSTAEALNAAGAAGDPWTTALPGAYGAGSAGNIIGNNLNATVGSRATQASIDTIDSNVDAILLDTNELQTDWVNGGRLDLIIDAILADTNELQTDWVNGGRLDLLIDAIKAKTDNLPASPAAVGSAMTLTSGERDAVAAALLDLASGIEAGLTLRQAMRLAVASAAGKLSGAATTTVTIRNAVADSKNRIVATVDADGNRSAITTDLT